MSKITEFISKKSIGCYCAVAAALFNLIGCILYGVSRENVNAIVIVFLVLAIAVSAAVIAKPIRCVEFAAFGFTVAAMAITLNILLENVAQIMFKNNVLGLSATFIPAFVFMVLGLVASILAVVFKQEKE